MGKKRRLLRYPKKFAAKYSLARGAQESNEERIGELPPVVEEVSTPVLDAAKEEKVLKPTLKADTPKKKTTLRPKLTKSKAKKTTSKK